MTATQATQATEKLIGMRAEWIAKLAAATTDHDRRVAQVNCQQLTREIKRITNCAQW